MTDTRHPWPFPSKTCPQEATTGTGPLDALIAGFPVRPPLSDEATFLAKMEARRQRYENMGQENARLRALLERAREVVAFDADMGSMGSESLLADIDKELGKP